MNPTIRFKYLALVSSLVVAVAVCLSSFFLNLYGKDKREGVLLEQRVGLNRFSDHFGNIIRLATVIDPSKLGDSSDIILLTENPCDALAANRKTTVSKTYVNLLARLGLDPQSWSQSLEVFKACSARSKDQSTELAYELVPSSVMLSVPYAVVILYEPNRARSDRLALLSLEGMQTSPFSTLFISNTEGEILWSEDGENFLKTAFADSGAEMSAVVSIAQKQKFGEPASVTLLGRQGLMASVSPLPGWMMASFSFYPSLMKPVTYAFMQFLFFLTGFISLALLVAKRSSVLFTKPLEVLKSASERISLGDFSTSLAVAGNDEISQAMTAFNTMSTKIKDLLGEVKHKAELEAEIKVAGQVQALLLPEASVETKSAKIYGQIRFADQCGGDWWGYLDAKKPNGDSVSIVLVGDATDHGIPPALITAAARGGLSIISNWLEKDPEKATDPCWIMGQLNKTLYDSAKGKIVMTLFVAIIDAAEGKVIFRNAGSPTPFLVSPPEKLGEPSKVAAMTGQGGVPIGLSLETVYEGFDVFEWTNGSRLFAYSDGLIECFKGKPSPFKKKDILRLLEAEGRLPAAALLRKLLEKRRQLAGDIPQLDDITMIICDGKA